MPNLFDYLRWRGDIRFEQDGLNEVDNLVFSGMSYSPFDGIAPDDTVRTGVTIRQAAEEMRALKRFEQKSRFLPPYPELLKRAAETVRFKDVVLTNFVNKLNNTDPYQFSAVVFTYARNEHYVAFRGTDDNLAGWKEDFLMGFKAVVPAQSQAVDYVNTVVHRLKGQVILGGHSKGGNLAVFSAVHTSDTIRRRITAIYNNDGPGFHTPLSAMASYKSLEGRVHTFIPKSSVVGMLLEHDDDYTIVASTEKGILSHNPLTWEVLGPTFIHETELSKFSRQTNETLRSWLNTLSMEQREQFVEALFDIIQASGAQTLSDLSNERLAVIDAMIKKLRSMDKKTRVLLRDTIVTFFSIRQKVMRESLGESLESLVAKK